MCIRDRKKGKGPKGPPKGSKGSGSKGGGKGKGKTRRVSQVPKPHASDKVCFKCGKKGHFAADCPNEPTAKRRRAEANVAEDTGFTIEECVQFKLKDNKFTFDDLDPDLISLKNSLTKSNGRIYVIDMSRLSCHLIRNHLFSPASGTTVDFVADTAKQGGSSAAKYITRPIVLANDSSALDVRLSAYIPGTSEVELYFRLSNADDARNMHELIWTPFNTDGSPDTAIAPLDDNVSFREYQYSDSDLNKFTAFSDLVDQSFATKRKGIKNNLKKLKIDYEKLNINQLARAEELSIEDFISVFQIIDI